MAASEKKVPMSHMALATGFLRVTMASGAAAGARREDEEQDLDYHSIAVRSSFGAMLPARRAPLLRRRKHEVLTADQTRRRYSSSLVHHPRDPSPGAFSAAADPANEFAAGETQCPPARTRIRRPVTSSRPPAAETRFLGRAPGAVRTAGSARRSLGMTVASREPVCRSPSPAQFAGEGRGGGRPPLAPRHPPSHPTSPVHPSTSHYHTRSPRHPLPVTTRPPGPPGPTAACSGASASSAGPGRTRSRCALYSAFS